MNAQTTESIDKQQPLDLATEKIAVQEIRFTESLKQVDGKFSTLEIQHLLVSQEFSEAKEKSKILERQMADKDQRLDKSTNDGVKSPGIWNLCSNSHSHSELDRGSDIGIR